MRYWCIAFLLVPASLTAADSLPSVRATDPLAERTLARAIERSAIVRALVAALDDTDVIVHVSTAAAMPAGLGGTTRFVTSSGGCRYLRITIASTLREDLRVVLLGHELEHAREIAHSTAADLVALLHMLEERGYRVGRRSYETTSARRVEQRIRRELQTEPVVELDHEHLRAAGAKAAAEVAKR